MKKVKLNLSKVGFTLVELLIVIAVIAVIAGATIGSVRTANDSAHKATVIRNAQQVTMVLNSAAAAGVNLSEEGVVNSASAVSVSQIGITPKSGAFAGKMFRSGSIPAEMTVEVSQHLTVSSENYIVFKK